MLNTTPILVLNPGLFNYVCLVEAANDLDFYWLFPLSIQ